jgi:hypothetical protein
MVIYDDKSTGEKLQDSGGAAPIFISDQEEKAKKIFSIWSELNQIPSIGPFHAYSKDFFSYLQEIVSLSQPLLELQTNFCEYWIQMNKAYGQALNEVIKRSPRKYNSKMDFENYRKITIDAFENAFTGLFESREFAVAYDKILSSQLDLFKGLQNISEKNLKVLNLPTRGEVDEIIKDLHGLKKIVSEMKRKLEEVSTTNGTRSGTS